MVKPLQPLKTPWAGARWIKWMILSTTSIGGGVLVYHLLVKAPVYNGEQRSLRGKTIIVTEATGRMSREVLRQLAKQNARIVLTSKSVDDCEDTRSKLLRSTGIEDIYVDCRRLDIESSRSIRRFAGSVLQDYPRIDGLVIQPPGVSTGVVAGARRLTSDGFEHQLGTNYFSFYLLTRLLLPGLLEAGKVTDRGDSARIVFTIDTRAASFAECLAKQQQSDSGAIHFPLDNWNWDRDYSPSAGYQRAQWALSLFADELAVKMANSGVSVLVADPDVRRTSQPVALDTRDQFWLNRLCRSFAQGIFNLGFIFTRLGARRMSATECMCLLASAPGVELSGSPSDYNSVSSHGAPVYKNLTRFVPTETVPVGRQEAQRLLWALSDKWTRLNTHPDPVPLPPRFKLQS